MFKMVRKKTRRKSSNKKASRKKKVTKFTSSSRSKKAKVRKTKSSKSKKSTRKNRVSNTRRRMSKKEQAAAYERRDIIDKVIDGKPSKKDLQSAKEIFEYWLSKPIIFDKASVNSKKYTGLVKHEDEMWSSMYTMAFYYPADFRKLIKKLRLGKKFDKVWNVALENYNNK